MGGPTHPSLRHTAPMDATLEGTAMKGDVGSEDDDEEPHLPADLERHLQYVKIFCRGKVPARLDLVSSFKAKYCADGTWEQYLKQCDECEGAVPVISHAILTSTQTALLASMDVQDLTSASIGLGCSLFARSWALFVCSTKGPREGTT